MIDSPTWSELLAAVQAAVERTNWNRVARELGMTPQGVKSILRGKRPMRSTVLKVTHWHAWRATGHPSPREAEVAIAGLAGDFPAGQREKVVDWLRDATLAMRAHAMAAERAAADGKSIPSSPPLPPAPDFATDEELSALERSRLELFKTL